MNFTKTLLATLTAIAMTTANFAAEKIDETEGTVKPKQQTSNNWNGSFATENGPVFNHFPRTILIVYEGTSSNVLSNAEFNFSPTSGIDNWRPLCELKLHTSMTPQQFFDALSQATNILTIEPPKLADFLKK